LPHRIGGALVIEARHNRHVIPKKWREIVLLTMNPAVADRDDGFSVQRITAMGNSRLQRRKKIAMKSDSCASGTSRRRLAFSCESQ